MATEKKIAVAGATGRLGTRIVEVLREREHEVVPMSRATGVDVITGEGLADALEGVELIVDAATGPSPDQQGATEFFTAAARNLQQAAAEKGVPEILVISIIGIDHFATSYYAAKVAHERAHYQGPVPVRVLRAGQFHEFVGELLKWGTDGDTARVWGMKTQLVSALTVAEAAADLIDAADAAPRGNPVAEIAGPRAETLAEMAQLLADKQGDGVQVEGVPIEEDPEGLLEDGVLLPGRIAKLAGPSYEEWLNG